jgi:hypothetical protein
MEGEQTPRRKFSAADALHRRQLAASAPAPQAPEPPPSATADHAPPAAAPLSPQPRVLEAAPLSPAPAIASEPVPPRHAAAADPAPPAIATAAADLARPAPEDGPHPPAASPALPEPIRITPPLGMHVRIEPEGLASQPGPFDATMPRSGTGGDPDWLTERLARDAALNTRSEWTGRWSRRAGTWGAAGVLLALLAGGGFWLYQQSQVEGALVVVANTNPPEAPATATLSAPAQPGLVRTTPALPSDAGVATVGDRAVAALPATPSAAPSPTSAPTSAPAATPATEPHNATGMEAKGGLAGASTAAASGDQPAAAGAQETPAQASPVEGTNRTVVPVPVADQARASAPKRQRSHAKKRAKVEARAAEPEREPSPRQRREETLMQCRAHGYDERQCMQRGCEMTRFGFACKG